MIKKELFVFILLSICGAAFFTMVFNGCETTPQRTGLYAGTIARIGFDSESDRALLGEIKDRIDAFLASGDTLTEALITAFVSDYSDRISPAVLFLVVEDLNLQIVDGKYDADSIEFLEGLSLALQGL
tara:strand:- start:715 stop:1098 length:384 start_codon:yes stop_codon:yes gene_type:complete